MAKVVLSLVGKQGSGKSTLGKKLARYLGTQHVETSDIVKALNRGKKRDELPSTGERTKSEPDWLAVPLYDQLFPVFNKGKQTVVLTGVREVEVHTYLKRRGLQLLVIDITADPDVRFYRLFHLEKITSAKAFIEQDLKERALGINEVIDSASVEVRTSHTSDPDKLVRALVSKITNEGTRLRE